LFVLGGVEVSLGLVTFGDGPDVDITSLDGVRELTEESHVEGSADFLLSAHKHQKTK